MPSGTMSNAVAVRTHTSPGDEVVCEIENIGSITNRVQAMPAKL